MPAFAPFHSNFWDQWVRFFVTKNPAFDSLTLDPENPGPWQARIAELTGLQDINQADLSAFAANGGKLLMAHGTADQLVQHTRHRPVLQPGARHHGGRAREGLHALLPDPGLRACRRHGVQRQLGFAERARELGREGRGTDRADRGRHRGRAGPHPAALRLSGLAQVQGQRRTSTWRRASRASTNERTVHEPNHARA